MSYNPTLICGNFCTLSISNDYTVYVMGSNKYGKLGFNDEIEIIHPQQQIPLLNNIYSIQCGLSFTICLNHDGEIFSMGRNDKGQLGINSDIESVYSPQKIQIPIISSISCGDDFTICITDHNLLYSFGNNQYGQLGLSHNTNCNSPQLIPDLTDIEFSECGSSHTICKTLSCLYYSWGKNYEGQLGQGNKESCNKPIQCLNWPDNIISIKCGYSHSLILSAYGNVYSFGSNSAGESGRINNKLATIPTLIEDLPEIKRIETGSYHSMCVDTEDYLWVFGNNSSGQLGLPDVSNRSIPTKNTHAGKIIDLSYGSARIFTKNMDNEIYAAGTNTSGQLGIEKSTKKYKTLFRVLEGKEDTWYTNISNRRAKSARK